LIEIFTLALFGSVGKNCGSKGTGLSLSINTIYRTREVKVELSLDKNWRSFKKV